MAWYDGGFEFPEYVSVAERRARARAAAEKIARKQKRSLAPVGPLVGKKIVRSFWGKAWCENLESYRDYEYRLLRGRSYVRHGAVLDLKVSAGKIGALVCGAQIYEVEIVIKPLSQTYWSRIKTRCAGQVGSLIELLEGRLSEAVMRIITHRDEGMFPNPAEIQMTCSCPDVA